VPQDHEVEVLWRSLLGLSGPEDEDLQRRANALGSWYAVQPEKASGNVKLKERPELRLDMVKEDVNEPSKLSLDNTACESPSLPIMQPHLIPSLWNVSGPASIVFSELSVNA